VKSFVIPYRKLVTAIILDAVDKRKKPLLDMASRRCGRYPMMSTEHDCGQSPWAPNVGPGAGRPADKCIRSRTWDVGEWLRVAAAKTSPTDTGGPDGRDTNRGTWYQTNKLRTSLS
jgi:hypothetical protein